MNSLRWVSALLLALAVVAGGMLWLQRQSAAQLRGEVALLRDENRELAKLRAENSRLVAAQPAAAQLEAMRADHAAVLRLRGEIERLKAETDQQARELERANAPLIPIAEWKNAGRATPAATVETMLWMSSRRDVDAFAAILSFDPKLRPSVDAFFEVLPEAVRTQYGTVERLIASFAMPPQPVVAMQIAAERPQNADRTVLTMRLQDRDGAVREVPVPLQRSDDGWRLTVLPEAVQKIANTIGEQIAAARKSGG